MWACLPPHPPRAQQPASVQSTQGQDEAFGARGCGSPFSRARRTYAMVFNTGPWRLDRGGEGISMHQRSTGVQKIIPNCRSAAIKQKATCLHYTYKPASNQSPHPIKKCSLSCALLSQVVIALHAEGPKLKSLASPSSRFSGGR